MTIDLASALEELGLSRRETACYLALIELGSTKTGVLANKTEIPSSKIYEILGTLSRKGLVSSVTIGEIKHYQAANPDTLLARIDKKRELAKRLVPILKAKQQYTVKQSVELYGGIKAIHALYTARIEEAKPSEEYLVFSIDEENKTDSLNLLFKNLAARRNEKKLDVKILKNKSTRPHHSPTKPFIRYIHTIGPQGITIFRDTVIILTWGETPTAVKIESATMANQLKAFFHEQWKHANK